MRAGPIIGRWTICCNGTIVLTVPTMAARKSKLATHAAIGLEDGMDDYEVFFQVRHSQGWQMWHAHPSAEIALLERGACRMFAGDLSCDLKEGDAFYIPSNLPHGFLAHKPGGVQFTVMQICVGDLRSISLLKQLGGRGQVGFYHLAELDQKVFVEICHDLLRELMSDLPYRQVACQCMVGRVGVLLLRSTIQTEASKALTLDQHRLVDDALQWMQQHAHEGLRISDIARQANVSPSYFRRIFTRKVGVGPKHYLSELRLRNSRYLLLQRNMTIAEAAEKSGFSNPQQFSKAFRQFSGVSPLKWRAANAQKQLNQ